MTLGDSGSGQHFIKGRHVGSLNHSGSKEEHLSVSMEYKFIELSVIDRMSRGLKM